jgi:hypothetical protein
MRVRVLGFATLLALGAGPPTRVAADEPPGSASREYQIKAAFLYNFCQFVQWPDAAFPAPNAPLIIGILGDDPFGGTLDAIIRGERVGRHELVIERYQRPGEIGPCHVLFVSRSMAGQLEAALAAVRGRSVLTVGETPGFASVGGAIRLVTEDNRVRLRINLEAARAAKLAISSRLLRMAELVTPGVD